MARYGWRVMSPEPIQDGGPNYVLVGMYGMIWTRRTVRALCQGLKSVTGFAPLSARERRALAMSTRERRALARKHILDRAPCGCGLYAMNEPSRLEINSSREVVVLVSAWGAVDPRESGFRSEYQRIEHLCLSPYYTNSKRLSGTMRERYRVPVTVGYPEGVVNV